MLEVRRLSTWKDVESWKKPWSELAKPRVDSQDRTPSVFQSFEFNQAWVETYAPKSELIVLGVLDNGQLIGIAPLILCDKKLPFPGKALRFIGGANFASDFCAFILHADRSKADRACQAIANWIAANQNLWDELDFVNMLENSQETLALEAAFEATRIKHVKRPLYEAPTILLGDPERDKLLVNKKSLKRHFNWFKNQGTLEFKHLENASDIEASLAEFFGQHVKRRSSAETASLFLNPENQRFYRRLVELASPLGWIRFFRVTSKGVAIAYHFGFEHGGRYYWYKPSFNVNYLKKSPGEVLLKTLLEYSIDKKLREFDFTAGGEAFKYRFANHSRKLYQLKAFTNLARYACFVAYQGLISLKGQLNRLRRRISRAENDARALF